MLQKIQIFFKCLYKTQKPLFIIPIALLSFIPSPSWGEKNDFPEIIAGKAIEIMTEGVLLSIEFSHQDSVDMSFLKWRALVKFDGRIYSCSIDQMVDRTMDVSDPPVTRCKESV
ncbi:MAG: hypothetical protein RIR04_1849 [Pseudomonadota bacterium]